LCKDLCNCILENKKLTLQQRIEVYK
jgi:hypothetical protein